MRTGKMVIVAKIPENGINITHDIKKNFSVDSSNNNNKIKYNRY